MLLKKPKKRTSYENYTLLLAMVIKKRETPFKVKPFIKEIQPFCKTTNYKDTLLFIRIRGAKFGVSIEVQNSNYFFIKTNDDSLEFHLFCDSAKQLLQKLIKHNLLNP